MSHTPGTRSSSKSSVSKRVTLRDSKSSKKDIPRTEDESRTRDQDLDSKDKNEESLEAESLSQEDLRILDDLHALELVLSDLINRRARGSDAFQPVDGSDGSPSRRSSSASDAKVEADEKQTLKLEDQTTQADIRGLENFLDEIIDRRAHGRQTPPVDALGTMTDAEKTTTDIADAAQLRDSRLSQIVAISDDITKEIDKIDAELRKTTTKGISKTGIGQSRLSEPAPASILTSQEVANRSTSQTLEVPKEGQYGDKFESNGEDAIWSSFESISFPSESSSVQTLPPPPIEPIVQYDSDFSMAYPHVPSSADPFLLRAIQRILDLKRTFPDQNLYLIPSSSFPLAGIPHISGIFEIPISARANSQVTEAPTGSSSFPEKTPYVSVSSPDSTTTSFVEMEAPSEKATPKKMENLIGQTFLDYFNRSGPKASPTTEADAATPKNLPEVPIIVEARDNETTLTDHHYVVPDERKGIGELEQRGRTVSLPVEFNGAARQSIRRPRETSPDILLSVPPPAMPEPARYIEVMPDRQSGVKTSATSIKSEASGTTRKSSLRSAVVAQSNMKQMSASTNLSLDTVSSVPLATDTSAPAKKKVSFADIPSTAYIMVNSIVDEPEAALKPSVGFEAGWEAGKGVAPRTVYRENDMGAASQNSPSTSLQYCAHPRLAISTPSYPIRADVLRCCSNEAHRTSTETVANLIPSGHVVTGSITHVMTRARSSADPGRAICGSREKWVTRINSRNISCSSDNAICLCSRSGSFQSKACECLSIQRVSPSPSDVVNALRLNDSCSNCMTNMNCSCSRTRSGGGSDSQPPAKEQGTMHDSFPEEDDDEGSSSSSLCDYKISACDSQNRSSSSAAGVFFKKCHRKRTKNITSEK